MFISYIIPPLVGGIIGYITNDIAIRMLFRPHKAKYIFGMHIPFTPGIIPKEKGRLAAAIGSVISQNLMSREVLEQYLLSDSVTEKLHNGLVAFIECQKENTETLKQFLCHYLTDDELKRFVSSASNSLTCQVYGKLDDKAIGDKVAHLAMEHVIEKLMNEDFDDFLEGLVEIPRVIGKRVIGTVLMALRVSTERKLSGNISSILHNNGAEIIANLIDSQTNSLLQTPVNKLLEGKQEQLQMLVEKVDQLYRQVISEHLPRILATVDIERIVTDRINDMDMAETEALVRQVMKKELRAIVWFGAGLGFLLGWVNVFI